MRAIAGTPFENYNGRATTAYVPREGYSGVWEVWEMFNSPDDSKRLHHSWLERAAKGDRRKVRGLVTRSCLFSFLRGITRHVFFPIVGSKGLGAWRERRPSKTIEWSRKLLLLWQNIGQHLFCVVLSTTWMLCKSVATLRDSRVRNICSQIRASLRWIFRLMDDFFYESLFFRVMFSR